MTIFLPNELTVLRNAIDHACGRIVGSKQDRVFYSLFAALLEALRTHSLVGPYFLDFEKAIEKMNQEFRTAAFDAMTEEWTLLRNMHSDNWRIRIELARIRSIVTRPTRIAFSSLFHQLNFALFNLRSHPQCCRIDEDLVSSKRMDLVAKSSVPGNDVFEKRRTIQAIAAIDPAFCWGRMMFFLDCWYCNETMSLPKPQKGSWNDIGRTRWNSMWEAYDKMVLLAAKMDFNNSLVSPNYFPSPFVNAEHRIIRKDYEGFLQSLKQHLWNYLLQLEQILASQTTKKEAEEETPLLTLPGTQKGGFAIELAIKCWKNNPEAKYSKVYEYYLINCPGKRLAFSTWEKLISKAKIDPRPKELKVRGPGKKTLQKRPAI